MKVPEDWHRYVLAAFAGTSVGFPFGYRVVGPFLAGLL